MDTLFEIERNRNPATMADPRIKLASRRPYRNNPPNNHGIEMETKSRTTRYLRGNSMNISNLILFDYAVDIFSTKYHDGKY